MRIATGLGIAALMLSACGGEPPAAPVEPVAEAPAPAPEVGGPNTLTAEQTALARRLGYQEYPRQSFIDDYLRTTRRARRAMERVFTEEVTPHE